MKKLIMCFVMASIMLVGTTGCKETVSSIVESTTKETDENGSIRATDGYADGRIGDTMRCAFFEYTVESAEIVEEYNGYTPAEGFQLIDTVIKTKNVFGEEIPMFDQDYQIQWGDGDEDYGYCIEAFDDTMIPMKWSLAKGESKTYHVVYEVPAGTTDFSVSYLEYYEDDTEGDVFFVYFEL